MIVICKPNKDLFDRVAMALVNTDSKNIKTWNPKTRSFMDMVYDLNPSILMIEAEQLTEPIFNAIRKTNIEIVLFGISNFEFGNQKVLNIVEPTVTNIALKNIEGPTYKCNYCADIFRFRQGIFSRHLACDLGYAHLNEKVDIAPIKELFSVAKEKVRRVIGKFCPVYGYMGEASYQDVANLYKSAKFNVCVDRQYLWDIAYNEGYVVDVVTARNLKLADILDIEEHYNGPHLKEIIKTAKKEAITKHTSAHRALDIFSLLKKENLIESAQNLLERLI